MEFDIGPVLKFDVSIRGCELHLVFSDRELAERVMAAAKAEIHKWQAEHPPGTVRLVVKSESAYGRPENSKP